MLFVNCNSIKLGKITKWHQFKISATTKMLQEGTESPPINRKSAKDLHILKLPHKLRYRE